MGTISDHIFLSAEELYSLTDYKRSTEQIRWLKEHGYAHDIGASGKPKVLRAEVERHLIGAVKQTSNRRTRSPKLDTSAIRDKIAV